MRICPTCRTIYTDENALECVRDGARLVDQARFQEAQSDPLLGEQINERYLISERVGQGGMGTVYRATQSGLDRAVAIKVLKRELNVDQDTVQRFKREARAMSGLSHPNTVRVFDFGESSDGLLFLTMELLEGELITDRMAREGVLDLSEAVRFAQQILYSLAEAHSKGIVHRDLKPDNIFIARVEGQRDPVVKVLDFGIAKIVQPDRRLDQFETQAGTVFGTPRYMSPEQAQGTQLDARSDLYSVGVLLFQMVTGRPPFVDDDAVVVMAKHIQETPDLLSDAAPDRPIPEIMDATLRRAMAKSPDARFASAGEFADGLEGCLEALEGQSSRSPRSAWRHPRTRWAAGILLALLALWPWLGSDDGTAPSARLTSAGTSPPPLAQRPSRTATAPPDMQATTAQPGPESGSSPALPTRPDIAPAVTKPAPPERAQTPLTLRSAPGKARVYFQGKLLGRTPLVIEFGPEERARKLLLKKRGYQDERIRVQRGPESARVTLDRRTTRVQRPRRIPRTRAARARSRKATTRKPTPSSNNSYEKFD